MLRVLNRVPKQWKQRAETNYKGLEAILLIDSINHRSPVKDQPSNMATVNLLLLQKNIYKYVKKKKSSTQNREKYYWIFRAPRCTSLTVLWWCKPHQRWRPVCLYSPWKWQRAIRPLWAPPTTALLSAAKAPGQRGPCAARSEPSPCRVDKFI